MADQLTTLDSQLEQARAAEPTLQEALPVQAVVDAAAQVQQLAAQVPENSDATRQLDIELDPALNLLDTAARGASQLDKALDDIDRVARLAPTLANPLNNRPVLDDSLNQHLIPARADGTDYVIDPTPYLESFALRVQSAQDWAGALADQWLLSETSDDAPALDLAPYMLAVLEFLADAETSLAQLTAALSVFASDGRLGPEIADATRTGTEFATTLIQSLEALDGQRDVLAEVGPFLQSVPLQGTGLLAQAANDDPAAVPGQIRQLDLPVATVLEIMGRFARAAGQVDPTRHLVDQAAQHAPDLVKALDHGERTSAALMQLAGTLEELNRALVLQPGQQQAIANSTAVVQAWAVQAASLYPEAVFDVSAVAHLDPRVERITVLLDLVDLEMRELSAALAGFNQAFQDSSNLANAIMAQADTAIEPTPSLEALGAANQILALHPDQQQAAALITALIQAWATDASSLVPMTGAATGPEMQLEPLVGTLAGMLSQAGTHLQRLDAALTDFDRALEGVPGLADAITVQLTEGIEPGLSVDALNFLNQVLVLQPSQQMAMERTSALLGTWAAEASSLFPETATTMLPALQVEPQVITLAAMLSRARPDGQHLNDALLGLDQALQHMPELANAIDFQLDAASDLIVSLETLNLLGQVPVLQPNQQEGLALPAALVQAWVTEAASLFPDTAAGPTLELEPQLATLVGILNQAGPQLQQLDAALTDLDHALQNVSELAAGIPLQPVADGDPVLSPQAVDLLNQVLAPDPNQQGLALPAALVQAWLTEAASLFPDTGAAAGPTLDLEPQLATLVGILNQAGPQLRQLDAALTDLDHALQNVSELAAGIPLQPVADGDPVLSLQAVDLLNQVLAPEPNQQGLALPAALVQAWLTEAASLFPDTAAGPTLELEPQLATLVGILNQAGPQLRQLDAALTDLDHALQDVSELAAGIPLQPVADGDPALSPQAVNLLNQVLDPNQLQAVARTATLLQSWGAEVSVRAPDSASPMGPALHIDLPVGTLAGMMAQTGLAGQRLNDALSGLDQTLQYAPEVINAVNLQLDAASNLVQSLQAPALLPRTQLLPTEASAAIAGSAPLLDGQIIGLANLLGGGPDSVGQPLALDAQLATAFGFLGRAQAHMLQLNTALVQLESALQQATLLADAQPGPDAVAGMVARPLEAIGDAVATIQSGSDVLATRNFMAGAQAQVETWSPELARTLETAPRLAEDIGQQVGAAGSLIRPLANSDQPLYLQATPQLAGMVRSVSATSALVQGWAYELAGRYPEAERGYSQALRLNPELAWALSARGRVRWHLGRLNDALADLDLAILLSPDLAEAYRLRGHVHRELNQPLLAVADYDEALRLSPDDAATLIGRGELNALLGHPLEALRDYTQAIRLAPRSAIAYYNRGRVFQDLGQAQQAISDYSQAILYRPLLAPAYNARGSVLASLLRLQEALADLNEAVRLDPDMADAFHNRGTVHVELGRMQQALDDFNRALELDPGFAVAYNSRGAALLQLDRAEEALADFDAAIQLQPDFGPALRNRGTAYRTTGRLQEAVSDFSRAIELEPNEPITYVYRAGVYDELGRPREAVADFSEAIELDPHQAPVFYDRGVLQRELGRLQEALQDFDQAIRLEPDFTAAYLDRAQVKTGLGRLEDALADFTQAIRLNPDFLAAYLNRARLHLELQRYTEAVQDFSEVIRLNPDLFEAHYQRGLIHQLHLNRLETAVADFTEAIRLEPDNADAHNHRGEVQAALGNPYAAWHDFDEALRSEPEHTTARYNRGLASLELDQPREAMNDFDAVASVAPGQAIVHYYRAQAREALGFLVAALDDYNASIRLDPDYTDAYYHRGRVRQQLERFEQALRDYSAAVRLDPELAAAWFSRSEVLAALGQPLQALSDLTTVIRLDPDQVAAWFNRGLLSQELGDTEGALDDYTEALRLDPDLAAAYRNRSAIHVENESLPEALSDLDALIELAPDEATAHVARGDVHKALELPEEALQDYDRAVRLGIEETLLYYNRGAIKMVLGLVQEAVEDFTNALQLTADHVPALHSRARAHRALGNLEPALDDLTEVVRLDPANAAAFNDKGMVLQGMRMSNAAIADLNEAVRLDPSYAVAFHNRAQVKLSVKRYWNAIADFDKALELEPDYASALHGRGSAWWALVDHTKALADFNQAIRLDPANAASFGKRGQVYLYMGLFDEALADFDKALELNPASAGTYCSRGVVYRYLGESQAALNDFNETLRLKPNSYFGLYYRANTLRDLAQPEAALADYTKAVQLNPNFTDAFSRRSATYRELGQLPQALSDIDMAIELNPGDASFYGERGLIRSELGQVDLALDDFENAFCRFQRAGTSWGVDWIRSLAPNVAADAVCN